MEFNRFNIFTLIILMFLSAGHLVCAQQMNIRPALISTISKSYVKNNTLSPDYFYSNFINRPNISLSIEYLPKDDTSQVFFFKYSTHTGNFNIVPFPFTRYSLGDYIFGKAFLYESVDFHQLIIGALFCIPKKQQRKNKLFIGPAIIGNIYKPTNSLSGGYSTSSLEIISWNRSEENKFALSLEAKVRYVFNNKKKKEILSLECSYQQSLSWLARQRVEYISYLAPSPDNSTQHTAVMEYKGSAFEISISKGFRVWRKKK